MDYYFSKIKPPYHAFTLLCNETYLNSKAFFQFRPSKPIDVLSTMDGSSIWKYEIVVQRLQHSLCTSGSFPFCSICRLVRGGK
jgi:hypothetical protein